MTYEHTRKVYAHGIVGRVVSDDDPINPRTDYDNLCTMTCWHRRYRLGDEHSFSEPSDFLKSLLRDVGVNPETPELALPGALLVMVEQHYYISPLYLYDHGGVTISMSPFACRWDSGQVGRIALRKDVAARELRAPGEDETPESVALKCMEAEVEEYDQYLTGDVWGVVIEDEHGAELDSCWGFFGSDYARKQMDEMAGYAVTRTEAEYAERRYWAERDVMTQVGA